MAEIVIIVHVICQGYPQYIHHLLIFAQANGVLCPIRLLLTNILFLIFKTVLVYDHCGVFLFVSFKIVDFHLYIFFFNKAKYLFFLIPFEICH